MKSVFIALLLIGTACAITAAQDDLSPTDFSSSDTPEEVSFSEEKQYLDATVLLVDHANGMLGVTVEDKEAGIKRKQTFKVDPNTVYVISPHHGYADFSDITIGNILDVYTVIDSAGKEIVTNIVNYSVLKED